MFARRSHFLLNNAKLTLVLCKGCLHTRYVCRDSVRDISAQQLSTECLAPQAFITIEVIMDLAFWADIFVCFRTSYYENGREVFDPRLIAKRYLRCFLRNLRCFHHLCVCMLARSFFAIDLLSCIPGYPLAAVSPV